MLKAEFEKGSWAADAGRVQEAEVLWHARWKQHWRKEKQVLKGMKIEKAAASQEVGWQRWNLLGSLQESLLV